MIPFHENAPACKHHAFGSPVPEGLGLHSKPHIFVLLKESSETQSATPTVASVPHPGRRTFRLSPLGWREPGFDSRQVPCVFSSKYLVSVVERVGGRVDRK